MKKITKNQTRTILLLLLLTINAEFNRLQAQAAFGWAKQFTRTTYPPPFIDQSMNQSHCEGNGIAQDSNGNTFVTGFFSDTIDFDPGPNYFKLYSPYAGPDGAAYIMKLDVNGDLVWAKMLEPLLTGTNFQSNGTSIKVDKNNNIYVTGDFSGTVDFNPGIGVFNMTSTLDLGNIGIGSKDVFLLKLDSNGNFIWAKSWGGGGADYGKALAVDGIGNVYTSGMFCQSYDTIVDFDPGVGTYNLTTPTSSGTLFISKLDANGNFIWAKAPTSGNESDGTAITIDISNNVLITGNFQGNVDFDFGAGVSNLVSQAIPLVISDLFALKLDANGNFIWAKSIENTRKYSQVSGRAITSDALGNVIIALNVREQPGGAYGPYRSTDMNPGVGVNNLPFAWCCSNPINAYVVKLNSIGNFLWAKKLTDSVPSDADVRGIKVDACGNIFTTGTFYGIADFDPSASGVYTLNGIGGSNTFISKLNSAGNFVWAGRFEASAGNAIHIDSNGDVFTTGSFGGMANFDPGAGNYTLTSIDNTDGYVSKLTGTICCTITKPIISPLGSTNFCIGDSVILNGGPGYTTYHWLPSGETSQTITVHVSGNYSVTVSNSCGIDTSAVATVTVNPSPFAGITVGGSTTFCEGGAVILNGNIGASLTYQWTKNGAPIFGATAASYTANTSGNYAVVVRNSFSCSATSVIETVTANTLPTVTLATITSPLCADNQVVPLAGNPVGGSFSGTGISTSNFDPSLSGAGTFLVSYNYTNVNGCSATANQTVIVSVCTDAVELNTSLISIYPNPANELIHIKMDASLISDATIELYDAIGKRVIFEKVNTENTSIVINSLANGIYLVRMISGTKQLLNHFIKE